MGRYIGIPTSCVSIFKLWQLTQKKNLKKNLFLFDHFVNTIHTYTLSMSYIYNLNNTNMKILANMVIMRINNNKSRVRRLL